MSTAQQQKGFTLIELLVVIGIIALLISILLPVINRAQQQARATKCMANMRSIGQALVNYSTDNKGYIVPSFTFPASNKLSPVGSTQPMEGWCSILDRDGYAKSGTHDDDTSSVFYCPDTYDIYGMQFGQTTTIPGLARGYIEWPMYFDGANGGGDSSDQFPITMPDQGYTKLIRCSYWINSYNPVGTSTNVNLSHLPPLGKDVYYTVSVGWGPSTSTVTPGAYSSFHRTSEIRHSTRLITIADGVYMGRQSATELNAATGLPNNQCRVGYRHRGPKGPNTSVNVGFADGHVEAIDGLSFPQGTTAGTQMNGPTLFSDPDDVAITP